EDGTEKNRPKHAPSVARFRRAACCAGVVSRVEKCWREVIGSVLDGRYEIHALLGQGAMGAVYEARHTGTGRRVAIKVINSGDVNRDKKLVARFQREAKAAGSIDTQHITQVLDTGVDPESELPYMVMEFLQGEDLHALFKRLGPIAPDLALRFVAQACIGL